MKGVLIFITACIFIFSCSKIQKKEETKPVFEMKSVHIESENCKTDSSGCATFDVSYPEFIQLDTTVQAILQNYLRSETSNEKQAGSAEEEGKNFITDFDKAKRELPDYGMSWYFKSDASVLLTTDTLLSIQILSDSYTGGAHGNFNTRFVNIDPKTGALYLIDSFLKPGYREFLTELGEEEFRKEHELSDTTSLEEAEFTFPENQFALNENYGFCKDGIVFVYNSYEVASYVMGATEIIIPYEKLKDWMK